MVQYVFTPWRDRRELLTVRRQFYAGRAATRPPNRVVSTTAGHDDREGDQDDASGNSTGRAAGGQGQATAGLTGGPGGEEEEMADAAARVAMWVHRGHCPHMVESTALLAAAVLSDRAAAADEGPRGHRGSAGAGAGGYAVRAAYASAFSRFVTGLLDSHQDAARKQSMYALARRLALPASFVELRHQATHEALPSLNRLRDAAARALEWIWDYYWAHLGEEDAGGEEGRRREERECRGVVMGYLEGRVGEEGDADDGESTKDLWRELRRWDDAVVLRVLADIGDWEDDNAIVLGSLRLSRELLRRQSTADRGDVVAEDQWGLGDLDRIRHQLGEAREGFRALQERFAAGEAAPTTALDSSALVEQKHQDETGPGWAAYQGPWKPKPIGAV